MLKPPFLSSIKKLIFKFVINIFMDISNTQQKMTHNYSKVNKVFSYGKSEGVDIDETYLNPKHLTSVTCGEKECKLIRACDNESYIAYLIPKANFLQTIIQNNFNNFIKVTHAKQDIIIGGTGLDHDNYNTTITKKIKDTYIKPSDIKSMKCDDDKCDITMNYPIKYKSYVTSINEIKS